MLFTYRSRDIDFPCLIRTSFQCFYSLQPLLCPYGIGLAEENIEIEGKFPGRPGDQAKRIAIGLNIAIAVQG